MSGFGGEADVLSPPSGCPEIAKSGHRAIQNIRPRTMIPMNHTTQRTNIQAGPVIRSRLIPIGNCSGPNIILTSKRLESGFFQSIHGTGVPPQGGMSTQKTA